MKSEIIFIAAVIVFFLAFLPKRSKIRPIQEDFSINSSQKIAAIIGTISVILFAVATILALDDQNSKHFTKKEKLKKKIFYSSFYFFAILVIWITFLVLNNSIVYCLLGLLMIFLYIFVDDRKESWVGSTLTQDQWLNGDDQLIIPHTQLRLLMQDDGNLVFYNCNNSLWNSSSWNNPGAKALLQDDGNFVVYSKQGNVLWALGSNGDLNSQMSQHGKSGWSPLSLSIDGTHAQLVIRGANDIEIRRWP